MNDRVQGKVLSAARIRAGVWEGVLAAGATAPPPIEVTHQERSLEGVTVAAHLGRPGEWVVRAPIPAALLSDGVQTFLVRDSATGATLGHFSIITGVAMEDDIRAEMDLLRAELDMLKRAFRRHCLETMG